MEKPLREEELVKQLASIVDKVDIDKISALEKVQKEVMRYRKFSYGVLGMETGVQQRPIDVDIRNYAKYVLVEGSKEDKRDLLSCLRSRLELQDRAISLKIDAKNTA